MFQIDLIEKCRTNNRKAQMALYEQYCQGMFCVAMRFLKNEDDAEDVLQESFVKAFQKLDQYKGEVTFGAWLKRIVINKCMDFLKSKQIKLVELDENHMHINEAEADDWTINDGITVETVKSAMKMLPEKYRYVLQLYLLEGYDHKEISEILELTETTCRTRLLRGKGHLKEMVKNRDHGTGH